MAVKKDRICRTVYLIKDEEGQLHGPSTSSVYTTRQGANAVVNRWRRWGKKGTVVSGKITWDRSSDE